MTGMTRKQKLQKPSELIKLYSQKLSREVERKLSPLGFELNFQYRSPHIAHISGYIVFRIGWILEFDEILRQDKTDVIKVKYRYHLMNKTKKFILRYDNVPHFPKIKTYPHHKHTIHSVGESNTPGLLEVIDEVEILILKNDKLP